MGIATLTVSMAAAGAPPTIREEWISLAEASRILGAHPTSIQRAALAGSIRVRSIAGMRTRYSREDVESLKR